MPRAASSRSSDASISQAMMSTSWIAPQSTTTAVTGLGALAISASMRSRKRLQLAQNSIAEKR